jgi:phosphopantetheinyl transferase (holo-ACP synthase)
MEAAHIDRLHVTISHCRSFAVAYVVAEGEG